ncbi:MAG: SRPBCC family protein [Flavobacteriales bacterium]|nr:SRPBCC family protein [Flavobacteriales bacterium]
MKVLKIILMVLAVIVLAFLVIAAAGPKAMHVKESVQIEASPMEVYQTISDLKTWEEWGAWQTRDTAMIHEYSGSEKGLGAINTWKSANEGNGTQTIIEASPGKHMKMEMKFEGMEDSSFAEWWIEEKDGGSEVTWTMDQEDIPFVGRFFMMAFQVEKNVRKDYKHSLEQLKAFIESQERFEGDMMVLQDQWYIGLRMKEVLESDLMDGTMYEMAYGKLGEALALAEGQMNGAPMFIVHEYKEGSMDAEFAFPIADSVSIDSSFHLGFIAGGRALSALHVGPYETTASTWEKLDDYVMKHGFQIRHSPYEAYINDPADLNGPEEYETLIVYPIE